MLMSKQCLQNNIKFDKESLNRFSSNNVIVERINQRIKIFEDVLKNYTTKEETTKYCKKQISLFKAVTGLTIPISQGEFIIDLYHEILNEEKEYNKSTK